jgi:hypothetical protein
MNGWLDFDVYKPSQRDLDDGRREQAVSMDRLTLDITGEEKGKKKGGNKKLQRHRMKHVSYVL